MSLLIKLREPVKHFVYSDDMEDPYGDPISGFTQAEDIKALVSAGLTEEPDQGNRDPISSEFTLHMDFDVPLNEKDEVEVRGYRCSVEGLVHRWRNGRTGEEVGAVAHVKWVSG